MLRRETRNGLTHGRHEEHCARTKETNATPQSNAQTMGPTARPKYIASMASVSITGDHARDLGDAWRPWGRTRGAGVGTSAQWAAPPTSSQNNSDGQAGDDDNDTDDNGGQRTRQRAIHPAGQTFGSAPAAGQAFGSASSSLRKQTMINDGRLGNRRRRSRHVGTTGRPTPVEQK